MPDDGNREGEKRTPDELPDEDEQTDEANLVQDSDDNEELMLVERVINDLGCNVEIAKLLVNPQGSMRDEEDSRTLRQGQREVQAHVSEAYMPEWVTCMAEKMRLMPG